MDERIIECRFADDERPQFLFVLLENIVTKQHFLNLVKMVRSDEHMKLTEVNVPGSTKS